MMLSLLIALIVVFLFLAFLAALKFKPSNAEKHQEMEEIWLKALMSRLTQHVWTIPSLAFWWFMIELGQIELPGEISPRLALSVLFISSSIGLISTIYRVRGQLLLGWTEAQHTPFGRRLLKQYQPEAPSYTSDRFGPNGAVIKS